MRTHQTLRRPTARLVAATLCLLAGSAAIAQPDEPGGRQPARQAAQPDPARFRARLASMLEQLESSTERLRGAIETLDSNGSMEQAIEQLGGPMRARRLSEMWSQWGRPGPDDRPGGEGADAPPRPNGPGGRLGQERGPWDAPEVTPEQILAFLREHAPELGERLGTLREQDARRADAFLSRFAPRVAEIRSAQGHDPKLARMLLGDFTLGMQVLETGSRYARAIAAGEAEQADQFREELRGLVARQVDLRLARREHEIATLAERLAALQAEVQEQRDNREQLIDQVIEQAGQGRFRGGPGERGGRGGPPEGAGRHERRGPPDDR